MIRAAAVRLDPDEALRRVEGHFAGGSLRTVPLTGGHSQTITPVGLTPSGGTWGADNVLLFTGLRTGVNAVPAVPSGQVTPVTTLDRSAQEVAHESPQILPNSREFLYVVDSPKAASAGTYLGSLDGSVKVRLLPDPAVYAPPGYLLYVRDNNLFAQGFDFAGRRVTGVPALIAGNLTKPTVRGGGVISASANGLITVGGEVAGSRLAWFDRSGQSARVLTASIELHDFAASRDVSQLYGSATGVWPSISNARCPRVWSVMDGRRRMRRTNPERGRSTCRRFRSPAPSAGYRLAGGRNRNGAATGESSCISRPITVSCRSTCKPTGHSARANHARCSACLSPVVSMPTVASTFLPRMRDSFSSTP